MIKTIIDKLLGKTPASGKSKNQFGKREEVPVEVHGIDPKLVDRRAIDAGDNVQGGESLAQWVQEESAQNRAELAWVRAASSDGGVWLQPLL